jgi:predicted cupin superfamily sugar epimerase
MHPRAAELIRMLDLRPHPEGAWFAEMFRSPRTVDPRDGRPPRAALTGIWFLMLPGQRSAWHVVDSDEVWIHFEGSEIRLWTFDPARDELASTRLGPLGEGCAPQRAVPAGVWQAAEPLGAYSLSGACVGPGFDFADFRLLESAPEVRAALERADPALLRLA